MWRSSEASELRVDLQVEAVRIKLVSHARRREAAIVAGDEAAAIIENDVLNVLLERFYRLTHR